MNDSTELRDRVKRLAAFVFLATAAALFLVFPGLMRDVTQLDTLNLHAQTLLDDSLDRNLVTFLSISAIRAVISILEGSSIGVGFNLEVGDLVQPAYDYLHFIWMIFLYALMALSFYKLLFETQLLGIGFPLIGLGLALKAAGLFPSGSQAAWRRWGRLLMIAGILIAYVVPMSLLAAHYVSQTYLENVKAANAARIDAVQQQFETARGDILNLRDRISILNPAESIETIRNEAGAIAAALTQSLWDTMFAFLTFVIILMVELLLLPLASAYLLYKTITIATRRLTTSVSAAPARQSWT